MDGAICTPNVFIAGTPPPKKVTRIKEQELNTPKSAASEGIQQGVVAQNLSEPHDHESLSVKRRAKR